jgi:hypothetical protein
MTQIIGPRLPLAVLRASFIVFLVVFPQLLLGHDQSHAAQLVMLTALLAGTFTVVEYAAPAPSLTEFRDARPYNRIRVVFLTLGVLAACVMLRPHGGGLPFQGTLHGLGDAWGELLVPWTPVHLLVGTLPKEADPHLVASVRAAAAAAYGLSLLMLATFALAIRRYDWPGPGGFNVWVNLPQFDPTAGGDVVERMQRDAQANLALGLLLPIVAPWRWTSCRLPSTGLPCASPPHWSGRW